MLADARGNVTNGTYPLLFPFIPPFIPRFQFQDSPIDLLGGLQPATLMMPDRNRQDFGDDCHARIVTI